MILYQSSSLVIEKEENAIPPFAITFVKNAITIFVDTGTMEQILTLSNKLTKSTKHLRQEVNHGNSRRSSERATGLARPSKI